MIERNVYVVNAPVRACCGRPRGECRCHGTSGANEHWGMPVLSAPPPDPDDTPLLPPSEPCVPAANVPGGSGGVDPDSLLPLPPALNFGAEQRDRKDRRRLGLNAANDEDDILPLPSAIGW